MEAEKIPADRPFARLSKRHRNILLYGSKGGKLKIRHKTGRRTLRRERVFPGVIPALAERMENTASEGMRANLEKYMSVMPCEACGGGRLKPESLAGDVWRKKHRGALRHEHQERAYLFLKSKTDRMEATSFRSGF